MPNETNTTPYCFPTGVGTASEFGENVCEVEHCVVYNESAVSVRVIKTVYEADLENKAGRTSVVGSHHFHLRCLEDACVV